MRSVIRIFFRIVRLVMTPVVVTLDRLTEPRGIVRSPDEQATIDQQASELTLYHFQSCPFCIKTRRAMRRLSLPIKLCDAQRDPAHRAELLAGGGKIKVPCLRISEANGHERWMYESAVIIDYIKKRFS